MQKKGLPFSSFLFIPANRNTNGSLGYLFHKGLINVQNKWQGQMLYNAITAVLVNVLTGEYRTSGH